MKTDAAASKPDAKTWDQEFDLVVLGSGAAGLTASLVATVEGLRVLLVEKTDYVGGTTAYSAGTTWIPNNRLLREAGIQGDDVAAEQYLDGLVGAKSPRELRSAFLNAGPKMLDYLQKECGIEFRPYRTFVDYRQDFAGAGRGFRPLEPMPFDGRKLGKDFNKLRWPVPEWGLFGGRMQVLRPEVDRLMKIYKFSPDAAFLALRLFARYFWDRLFYKRGTRLVLGNALAGNLLYNFLKRGGSLWCNSRTVNFIKDGDAVSGVLIQHEGRELRVRAKRGVVLAAGGFPAGAEMRDKYLRKPAAQFTRACEGATGDTIEMAQGIGAAMGEGHADNALWFPASIGRRADGSVMVFPHIWDRAKPGLVAVNSAGKRFVDEAASYHEFVRGMYRSQEAGVPSIPALLVCDARFLAKYGLGAVRPKTRNIRPFIESGYLYEGATLDDLARQIGVDAKGLADTVAANNRYAKDGVDPDFNKGKSLYGLQYGDSSHKPNACLGPIEQGPFYAIPVIPTPLGTALGLKIDTRAQVLNASDQPIAGLYAAGCDANNVMGGEYPGGGAQVGSAMTFGFIAAQNAAGKGNTLGTTL